jgi:hypothetical protein
MIVNAGSSLAGASSVSSSSSRLASFLVVIAELTRM